LRGDEAIQLDRHARLCRARDDKNKTYHYRIPPVAGLFVVRDEVGVFWEGIVIFFAPDDNSGKRRDDYFKTVGWNCR